MEKVKAKKQYGQNFLKDTTILDKIIQSMPNNNNYVVEIGPGLGDLTKNLVKYKDMTAYEVDTDLIGILKSKFAIEIKEEKLKYPKEFIHDVTLFNEGNFMLVKKFQDVQMRYLMLSDFYDYARLTKKYKKT
mgnify:CR=1 FL=1